MFRFIYVDIARQMYVDISQHLLLGLLSTSQKRCLREMRLKSLRTNQKANSAEITRTVTAGELPHPRRAKPMDSHLELIVDIMHMFGDQGLRRFEEMER